MQNGGYHSIVAMRQRRAEAIVAADGIENALADGTLPRRVDVTLSEALVLGLLRQNVKVFLSVLGHGSTEVGEVLRVYHKVGLVRTCGLRNEIEAAHAATALRWVTGEKAAVITSIGPGALQAMAGSLASASDGVGVWHLYGEETTEDEGMNMQQIPKHEQGLFLRLCQTMGQAYTLHTPAAVTAALHRGMNTVDHPYKAGPFYLLMPMNTQCSMIRNFNLDELPNGTPPRPGPADEASYPAAVDAVAKAERIVVKVGGGARGAGEPLAELLERTDAAAVTSPLVSGVIPYDHPRNMTVGGSKGSLCGNFAMETADLLIAVGSRFVCQSDCSRTGYPAVKRVIHINADMEAATHYNRTIALLGDIRTTLMRFNAELRTAGVNPSAPSSQWLSECRDKKRQWEAFKRQRYEHPCLRDSHFDKAVLTQPAAIKTASDWARTNDVVSFYDAGDVQANGFQIVEDDRLGRTFTETGASYMGFAVSALLATGISSRPFYGLALTGDGSFMMNPQILIDGVEHGAKGCILLLDNRRMAAISGLQLAQFGQAYATSDDVEVDYVHMANSFKGVLALYGGNSPQELVAALGRARSHDGLSLIHVPVYFGNDELGGMGVFGRWNVGNWCDEVQAMRHTIGL